MELPKSAKDQEEDLNVELGDFKKLKTSQEIEKENTNKVCPNCHKEKLDEMDKKCRFCSRKKQREKQRREQMECVKCKETKPGGKFPPYRFKMEKTCSSCKKKTRGKIKAKSQKCVPNANWRNMA